MSRTAASYSMTVTRGATWEDHFIYKDEAGEVIDLAGYEARMQVRTIEGAYGVTGADSLVLELTTANGLLELTAAEGKVAIVVAAAGTQPLNPENLKKVKLAYSIELFVPAGAEPEYVVPLVSGSVTVLGEIAR